MKAYQLVTAIGPELQQQVISYMQTAQRAAYRAVVQTLASQRKLRPVLILDKTKVQQAAWMIDMLRVKSNDTIAEQVLQIWLLKGQPTMLTTFLDAAGISHDGKGEVEELPDDIPADKAEAAVAALLKEFPVKQVALYLHMFQMQRPDGWEHLTTAIAANPDLKLEPA